MVSCGEEILQVSILTSVDVVVGICSIMGAMDRYSISVISETDYARYSRIVYVHYVIIDAMVFLLYFIGSFSTSNVMVVTSDVV